MCDVCVCAHACVVTMRFYFIDHSNSDSVDVSRTMGDNIKIVDLPDCGVCVCCVRARVCVVCVSTNYGQKHQVNVILFDLVK